MDLISGVYSGTLESTRHLGAADGSGITSF